MTVELNENLSLRIIVIRGKKVMLSGHLAELYGVETKVLLQAVKRNIDRFPEDFMFQITPTELDSLRSQFVTLENRGRGQHPKYPPYAFTQEWVAMLSSVQGQSKRTSLSCGLLVSVLPPPCCPR